VNSTQLIAQVRLNTLTSDSDTDYTTAVVLQELNDSLTTKFQGFVTEADSGYWLQSTTVTTTTGQAEYRIPARSIGLSKVEISSGSSPLSPTRLRRISENNTNVWIGDGSLGTPTFFATRSDQVVLFPTPDNGSYTLRIWYFIRPSDLQVSQNSVSGTDRGRITAINTAARTVTVNVIPFDQSLVTPASITSGLQLVDIVHPDGWYELAMVGQAQTISGLVITLGGTDPMTRVQVGDYVRVVDQTDWPAIPSDFHRCLADIASTKILLQQDYQQKAAGFAGDVSADIGRFSALISDRVHEEPRTLRAALPMLRRTW
jgi:hypothetical protein